MLTWIDDDSRCRRPARWARQRRPGPGGRRWQVTRRRLEEAYRGGIFPWYSAGQPVLWWSPDPRMVLPVADFAVTARCARRCSASSRTPGCEMRFDSAFAP
jgi:leucyl/phenylalanyl-tRNA--protein transferase